MRSIASSSRSAIVLLEAFAELAGFGSGFLVGFDIAVTLIDKRGLELDSAPRRSKFELQQHL